MLSPRIKPGLHPIRVYETDSEMLLVAPKEGADVADFGRELWKLRIKSAASLKQEATPRKFHLEQMAKNATLPNGFDASRDTQKES